jgi:hypothetical protein
MGKQVVKVIRKNELCCICLENTINKTLNCKHSFCKECIYTWKKTQNSCPICRKLFISYKINNENVQNYIQELLSFYNHPEIYQDYIKNIQSEENLFIWNLFEKKKLEELSTIQKQKIISFIIDVCEEYLIYTNDSDVAYNSIIKVDKLISNGFYSIKKSDPMINIKFDSFNKFIHCFEEM